MIQCDILKERSYTGCLRASFELMCANSGHILRRTWWIAALIAALAAVPAATAAHAVGLLSIVASVLAACLLYACCMDEASGKGRRTLFLRTLKAYTLNVIVVTLFIALTIMAMAAIGKLMPAAKEPNAAISLWPYALAAATMLIVMTVTLVPALYSSMKYIVDGTTKLRTVYGKSYKAGWHSWGGLFITILLITLIAAVIDGIIYLPTLILLSAKRMDSIGVSLGDASALPEGFRLMRFAATAAASFVNAYVSVWALFTMYYVSGHIEAKLNGKTDAPQS